MIDANLARFESHIERLVESVFTSVFGRAVHAQDIALQIARALESAAKPSVDADPRPLAPDRYVIHTSPQHHNILVQRHQNLNQTLSQHVVSLARQAGYRLMQVPIVSFAADTSLSGRQMRISAGHSSGDPSSSTAYVERVRVPASTHDDVAAYLLVNGQRSVDLNAVLFRVGRARDNDLILDDPLVSRYHLQIRRRSGGYTLFDVRPATQTYVNGVNVREHPLRSGDVIRIGRSTLVFMDGQHDSDGPLTPTQPLI